jgi:predicted Zn-dependent protease
MKAPHPVRILLCALMLRACAGFAASAPAASAPAPASQPAAPAVGASELQRVPPLYTAPNNQIRYGNAALFRNLIPSSTLEAQAAAEYADLIRDAQTSRHLLGNDNPLVQRSRAILNKEIPFALKWNDRAKDWKWELNVVRSNDTRMYCLPGGKIVIYSGLITRLHLNDNELGMMIGHDIAHALREHARERLGRQQAAQLSTGSIPQLFGFIDLAATGYRRTIAGNALFPRRRNRSRCDRQRDRLARGLRSARRGHVVEEDRCCHAAFAHGFHLDASV